MIVGNDNEIHALLASPVDLFVASIFAYVCRLSLYIIRFRNKEVGLLNAN